jgi:hypothetical protein
MSAEMQDLRSVKLQKSQEIARAGRSKDHKVKQTMSSLWIGLLDQTLCALNTLFNLALLRRELKALNFWIGGA